MPNIRTKDLIKVYRTGKSEVIAHRVLEIQEGKIMGETAAA